MVFAKSCGSQPLLQDEPSVAGDPVVPVADQAELGTPQWDGPPQDVDELLAREAEITKRVPELLDDMNRSADKVNAIDKQLGAAQERCRCLAEQCQRLQQRIGAAEGALQPVRGFGSGPLLHRLKVSAAGLLAVGPLGAAALAPMGASMSSGAADSDAAPMLANAIPWNAEAEFDSPNRSLAHARAVTEEFQASELKHAEAKSRLRELEVALEAAGSLNQEQQDELSMATAEVLRCQKERDRLEQEHLRALAAFSAGRQVLATAGGAVARRPGSAAALPSPGEVAAAVAIPLLFLRRAASPKVRALRQGKTELAALQRKVALLTQQAKAAKSAYSSTMHELDRISMAVHGERKLLAQVEQASAAVFGDAAVPAEEAVPLRRRSGAASRACSLPPSDTHQPFRQFRLQFEIAAAEENPFI